MKPIKQKQGNDCAVAAIAMVVGKSYSAVKKVLGTIGRNGLHSYEMLWLIGHWGDWRIKIPRKRWTLREWAQKHPLCVVSVGMIFDCGHALAVVDGRVYDPSGNEPNLDQCVNDALVPVQNL